MAEMSRPMLLAKAKEQLGLPTNAQESKLPPHYISELEKHLELYPEGYKFRVTLHGGKGFGSITCLDSECGKKVTLKRRFGGDGGRTAGFGTLSAYRIHLADHAPSTRVKSEATPVDLGANTMACDRDIKPQPGHATQPVIATASQLERKPSAQVAVKVEPRDQLPRKRLSDVAFDSEEENPSATTTSTVAKKAKVEPTSKTPLSTVTNQSASRDDDPTMAILGFQDPSLRLQQIRHAIALERSKLSILHARRPLSVADMQLIHRSEGELGRLLALERICEGEVASQPSSSSRTLPSKPVPQPFPMIGSSKGSSMPVKKEPHSMHPFPMDVDVKPSERLPLHNNYRMESPRPMAPRKSEPTAMKVEEATSQASTSRASYPSAPDNMMRPGWSDSGDDDSENDDSYEYNMPQLMERIGIKAPPPVNDDAMDDNGDYHGRGRDLYEGPRASQDDFAKFLLNANAETFDGNASVDKALERLGLRNLSDPLPGMEVTLLAHQAIGVAWMVDKELGNNKGGCLADEMGLGKTVQMIATILKNRPTGSGPKTTLIITPVALIDQWKTEIELKSNLDLQCCVYHGPSKTTSKKKLLSHDIVLTTFGTLAREWPDYENEMKKKKQAKKRGDDFIASSDDEDMKDSGYRNEKRKEKAGLLFQVEFYRTVLDEAQNIRNRRTRISRAVVDVRSVYRWCLTGTPIINTLTDVYGYLRFLKIRPWYDWAEFNDRIARKEKKNPALAITRLHAIMNTFLLRRKKDTKLDGKFLIELPDKEVKMIRLEFSKEERDIYSMVEARNQNIFNRYLRAGTVLKNYHEVLVLLLRLRQICSHPSLIAEDASALVPPEEAKLGVKLVYSSEMTRASRLVSEEFVVKMKEKLRDQVLSRMRSEQESANATIEDDCPICFDLMTDAVITPCGHVFCRECIIDYIQQKGPVEPGVETDGGCPCCRQGLEISKLFTRSAFEPTDKELRGESIDEDDDIEMSDVEYESDDDMEYDPKGKGKARAHRRVSRRKAFVESDYEDDDMSDFIVESDEDEEEKDARHALKQRLGKKRANVILDSDDELDTPEVKEVLFGVRKNADLPKEALKLMPRFLPSSKMKYMMQQIQQLFKAKPDEKVLVVSQWTSCLQLVSDYLTEKNIPHVKYQGDMSRTKREQAVRVFMAKEKAKVMLMSLKAGGMGLNLTRANHVISLDLGWSQAIEAQAFDRIHRLGQKRDVIVQRVVIADTVEDRILALQDRKQNLADGSLGEGSGKKMGRLSVAELANLFGLDARGRRIDYD